MVGNAVLSQSGADTSFGAVATQVVALLCWAAVAALGWHTWRRRRGDAAVNLLIAGGLALAARVGLLVAGTGWLGLPGGAWMATAVDLAGLVLLVWPLLSPPVTPRQADRVAGIALTAVAVACCVSLWQWALGLLGLQVLRLEPAITWAHAALTVAVLAALNLSRHPSLGLGFTRSTNADLVRGRGLPWLVTAACALLAGIAGPSVPAPRDPLLRLLLTSGAALIGAAWLGWLGRTLPQVATAGPRPEPSRNAWRPFQWLEASTAIFVAPDLAQLLQAAMAVLAHVMDVRLAGLLLADEGEPPRLRLAARCPQTSGPVVDVSFSPDVSPVIADTLTHGRIANVTRELDRAVVEPLDRILGGEVGAALLLPLAAQSRVLGLLALALDGAKPDTDQLRLCGALADQVSVAIDHLQLHVEIVQQARSLAHLVRRHSEDTGRLLSILETVADGVIVADADDKVVLANSAALDILSLERTDALGSRFGEIVDWRATVGDGGLVRRMAEMSPYSMEAVFEVAGRHVQTSMAPIENPGGVQVGAVALLRDITEVVRTDADRERELIELRERSQQLEEAADHLRALIWDGKTVLALGETDVAELIEDAIAQASSLVGAKPVRLIHALELGLPKIRADRARLRQVLLNLLAASVRRAQQGQITVSAARNKGYIVISIAHIRTGVSPEYADALREALGRRGDTAPRSLDGLSLGLSVSRRLVEQHGGKTWVKRGGQLTVYVGLPVDGPPAGIAS